MKQDDWNSFEKDGKPELNRPCIFWEVGLRSVDGAEIPLVKTGERFSDTDMHQYATPYLNNGSHFTHWQYIVPPNKD